MTAPIDTIKGKFDELQQWLDDVLVEIRLDALCVDSAIERVQEMKQEISDLETFIKETLQHD